jgi:hypothetical protein
MDFLVGAPLRTTICDVIHTSSQGFSKRRPIHDEAHHFRSTRERETELACLPPDLRVGPDSNPRGGKVSFDVAVVREQGQTFAVVAVKSHAFSSEASRTEAALSAQTRFPGMPIVLMSQGSGGRPTFWGRPDIVRFLSNVAISRLPWRRFNS